MPNQDPMVPIAGNYLTQPFSETIRQAMDLRTYTFQTQEIESGLTPVITMTDALRDKLNYVLMPEHIKTLTSRNNTGEELLKNIIANQLPLQQLETHTSKDTLGMIRLLQDMQDNKAGLNALATVADIETTVSKDSMGNARNWIYEAAFEHVHKGNTIGHFKDGRSFQNFYIGIYDKEEAKYLQEIAEKVKSTGLASLNNDEKVTFEFLSRLGASISRPEDLMNISADQIKLTDAAKESFATVDNFMRAVKGRQMLGDKQFAEGNKIARRLLGNEIVDKTIASGGRGLNDGIRKMADNLAEIIINQNSMITGWNIGFDVSNMMREIRNNPLAEAYLNKRLEMFGRHMPNGRLPDDLGLGTLASKAFDPFRDMLLLSDGQTSSSFLKDVYGENYRDIVSGVNYYQFENIQQGMFRKTGLDIYQLVHHSAGGDVKQESAFILDANSPLRPVANRLESSFADAIKQYEDEFTGLDGMLFQARDSGSMQTVRKYNRNVFAMVEGSNGNLYMSNGFTYNKAKNQLLVSDQFTPGGWSRDVTYRYAGSAYIKKDSEIAKMIAASNDEFIGQDLVRVDLKLAFLNSQQKASEIGQETRYLFMPAHDAGKMLNSHFDAIGYQDENGRTTLNQFGKKRAEQYRRLSLNSFTGNEDLVNVPRTINQQKILDRAERSFNKYSLQTNENALHMRDIVKSGTFAQNLSLSQRMAALQDATLQASRGNMKALTAILQSTGSQETAEEFMNRFVIKKSFSDAWMSNTATIAGILEEGSLMEQIHRSAVGILNSEHYAAKLATNNYARNAMYNRMVQEAVEFYKTKYPVTGATPLSIAEARGATAKYVDDIGKFHVDVTDFIRGYRSERYIPGEVERTIGNWMRIDLNNIHNTRAEILRVTGLKGRQNLTAAQERNAILSFADFMSRHKDLNKEEKQLFRSLFDNTLADKGTGEILSGLNLAFRDIKINRPGSGFAPELAINMAQSHLTMKKMPAGFVGSEMEQWMKRVAQQEYEMIDKTGKRKEILISKLEELIYGHDLQGGVNNYTTKYVSRFDKATQAAAREIYRGHESAVHTLAQSLVGMFEGTGIGISVDPQGAGKVMLHYGNANYDMTDLIPKLRTNSVGSLSWMIGQHDTRYVAAADLRLMEKDGQLMLGIASSLDDALQKSFIGTREGYEGSWARKRLQQKILAGENPIDTAVYYMKEILRPLRENSRMSGSTSGDWRHFMTAGTNSIFSEASLNKIIAKAGNRVLDANQAEAIETLRKYRDDLKAGKNVILGESQGSALYKLMSGDNPLISPTIVGAPDIILDATAKQTSTEGIGVLLAPSQSVIERQTDLGKMVANQLDNALYFRVNPTAQDREILRRGNIRLGYGPQMATKGERALNTIESGGIKMTNRLMTGIVEADDRVKEQIYQMLVDKNKNDRTIANVFAKQFMPYEGGGWINSRLWDTIQNASAWQAINFSLKPGDMKAAPNFMKRAGLQFKELADGTQEFTGYGRGIFVKQGDKIAQEYQRYFNDYRDILAKQDSIYSMAYITREGNQIVDADTLKRVVTEELDKAGKKHTQDEFLAMANSLYDRKLIARRVFDEGDLKLGFDTEKHVSVPGLREIASYTTNKEEQILHDILYSKEFDEVAERLGTDFRSGRTLSADIYYDIARMDFNSPIFTKSQGEKIRQLIRSKSPEKNAEEWFFRAMDAARHKLSDQVELITHGGEVLGASMTSVASHRNVNEEIRAAIYYIQRQMHKDLDTVNLTDAMRQQDMQKAVEMINGLNVLTDWKDRKIGITVEADGSLTFSTNAYNINPNTIKEIYRFNGTELAKDVSEKELMDRQFQYLSAYRDTFELPNGKTGIFAHYGEVAALLDPLDSPKGLKITDREIETFSNTLYDEQLVGRLKTSMGDAKYEAIFGKAGIDAENRMRTSVWGKYLDAFYRDTAFMRWDPSMLDAEHRMFDANRLSGYRKIKTAELVQGLGKDVNVSMEYANDLYEVASLQRAVEFNSGKAYLSAEDLLSDKGKASSADYFKRVDLKDAATVRDNIRSAKLSPFNIYENNLLVNLEDARLGLNSQTLNGRTQIALAGVDLVQDAEDASSTEFQRKFSRLQNQYDELVRLHEEGYMHNGPEYTAALAEFNKIKDSVVQLQDDYAHNKVKSSVANRVLSARMPASINNKVLAFSTGSTEQESFEALLEGKTFDGENLIDIYRKGKTHPNIAIIGEADMKRMGFNDAYFRNLAGTDDVKQIAKVREAWIKKASTEGLQGTVHRFPTDYWGSTMAVRIYFDRNIKGGTTRYDEITAAFLKADADGDYAQAAVSGVMHGGKFYDLDAAAKLTPGKNATAEEIAAIEQTVARAKALQKEHAAILNIQRYDTNKMVIRKDKYIKMANQTFQQYLAGATEKDLDVVNEFVKKGAHIDLSEKIMPARTEMLTPEIRKQYLNTFEQHRGAMTDALNTLNLANYTKDMDDKARKTFFENIDVFRNGKTAEAVGALQSEIATNKSFRRDLYNALGSQKDKINMAFRDAASVGEAQLYALQRIARKGVGLADTPFTATGFLRMTAVMAPGDSVLSNAENASLYMMKELEKEQLLTVKKMEGDMALKTTANLDKLNEYINRILKEGKPNESLKKEFVSFMTETARSPGTRYKAESLLLDFAKEQGSAEISAEKAFGTGYDALVKTAQYARSIGQFEVIQNTIADLSAAYKGRRLSSVRQQTETFAAKVTNTIMQSNSVKDGMQAAAEHQQQLTEIEQRGAEILAKQRAQGKNLVEKVVRNYRPGKGLAIAALGLAGAAVFGGYAGGNPATPAQQQAQTMQEQGEMPPRNINMADPSLTASNRKQAGYVININAQTQRDKEYASRLITQAVTKNFQDTNVNVSMNVNQQPGNISGKDLMDYLEQVL